MADTFQLRHKRSGFVTRPVTEAEAKGIAGYPGDYEKVVPAKPLVVKDAPAKAARKRKGTKPKAAAKPKAAPAPSAPAADSNETQD